MAKINIPDFAKHFKDAVVKYSPEILTGLGIAGMITTTVLAVKATPKAMRLMELEKRRQNRENEQNGYPEIDKLNVKDTIKTTWKCYLPATAIGASSIACLIGASSVNFRRNAMLATAYKLSESALIEYKEKVIETIGEKKEEAIRDKIAEDRVRKNPSSDNAIIVTGNGDTLCFDWFSKRHFKSDINKIKKAENEINKILLTEGVVSLNDFYDELGLEHTQLADYMGWNTDMGIKLIELQYSSQLDDGVPCLVIDFVVPPKYEYDRYH